MGLGGGGRAGLASLGPAPAPPDLQSLEFIWIIACRCSRCTRRKTDGIKDESLGMDVAREREGWRLEMGGVEEGLGGEQEASFSPQVLPGKGLAGEPGRNRRQIQRRVRTGWGPGPNLRAWTGHVFK